MIAVDSELGDFLHQLPRAILSGFAVWALLNCRSGDPGPTALAWWLAMGFSALGMAVDFGRLRVRRRRR